MTKKREYTKDEFLAACEKLSKKYGCVLAYHHAKHGTGFKSCTDNPPPVADRYFLAAYMVEYGWAQRQLFRASYLGRPGIVTQGAEEEERQSYMG